MGCCLGKIRPKRNRVSPSYMEAEIRQRISGNSSKRQTSDPVYLDNMARQLEEGTAGKQRGVKATLKPIKIFLLDNRSAEVDESKMTKGGVSFTLDFKTGDPTRMPSRLAGQVDGAQTPTEDKKEVHYTASEREILAELFREDILREKSVKARRDVQIFDASRRRDAYNT